MKATHTQKGRARSTAEKWSPGPAQTEPKAHLTSGLASFWQGHPPTSFSLYCNLRLHQCFGRPLLAHNWLMDNRRFWVSSNVLLVRCSLPFCHDTLDFLFESKYKASYSSQFNFKHWKNSGSRAENKGLHLMLKVYAWGKTSQTMFEMLTESKQWFPAFHLMQIHRCKEHWVFFKDTLIKKTKCNCKLSHTFLNEIRFYGSQQHLLPFEKLHHKHGNTYYLSGKKPEVGHIGTGPGDGEQKSRILNRSLSQNPPAIFLRSPYSPGYPTPSTLF